MPDLSHILDLPRGSWQRRILDPLSEAGDRTRILVDIAGFVTTEPQRELPGCAFLIQRYKLSHTPPTKLCLHLMGKNAFTWLPLSSRKNGKVFEGSLAQNKMGKDERNGYEMSN